MHLAVSPDQFRIVYFQGHPEYDINSLLKEYKREVGRYLSDELSAPPPYPENYFNADARAVADAYIDQAERARRRGAPLPPFPESAILPHLDNTWGDTGKAIFNNWLGLVYRLTHLDRRQTFHGRRRSPESAGAAAYPYCSYYALILSLLFDLLLEENSCETKPLPFTPATSREPTTKAVAVPIYQTVAYEFDNAQHGADLFNLAVPGNIYTRIMNPTQAVLEERVAALEGGIAALAISAGSAAINYAILTIAETGNNIVSVPLLYGGTYTLFAHMLPKQGIEVRFAER